MNRIKSWHQGSAAPTPPRERTKNNNNNEKFSSTSDHSATSRPFQLFRKSWVGKRSESNDSLTPFSEQGLQASFEGMVEANGYQITRFRALETAHQSHPSAYQLASFDAKMIDPIVQDDDCEKLEELLSIGWSPNACDDTAYSIVHKVCRRGMYELFEILVNRDAALYQCDSEGRTVLHEACKSRHPGSWALVDLILEQHPHLFFVTDARGKCPLEYVRTDQRSWRERLQGWCDEHWPKRDIRKPMEVPRICQMGPCTMAIPNPKNALSNVFMSMVVSGCVSPKEALLLQHGCQLDEEDITSSNFEESVLLSTLNTVKCQDFMSSVSSIKDLSTYLDELPVEVGIAKQKMALAARASAA